MESARAAVMPICDAESFADQLNDFADRVRRLQHANLQMQFSPELLEQSLAELGNAVEELQVAQEEMTRQRHELGETQGDLAHQRQRYKELFDYAPTPYLVTNLVGTIADANGAAATLLQMRREFLVGGSLLTFVEIERRASFREALACFASSPRVEAPQTWEMVMLRRQRGSKPGATHGSAAEMAAAEMRAADGEPSAGQPGDDESARQALRAFDAELIVSRMHTLLNEPDKLLWLVRDVTAHNEFQRLARHSERLAALGQMVATFAHESGNALQRSQAALEMLASRVADRAQAMELLAEVQNAHDHLAHLQKQIKDYAGPVRIEKAPCHVGHALERAWDSLHLAKAHRQAHLEHRNEAASLSCAADFGALQQVFRNVLENSLAACGDPVRIHACFRDAAWRDQPALEIRIADNGPGMSPAVRQRIFEPFFTTRVKGMGLGMAIVRRIVEAHGGQVAVDGVAVDGAAREGASAAGARVIIILPRGEL